MNELFRHVHGNKTKKYKSVKKLIRNYCVFKISFLEVILKK